METPGAAPGVIASCPGGGRTSASKAFHHSAVSVGSREHERFANCCACVNAACRFGPQPLAPCRFRPVNFVVRIRLSLADRAGALGQAATVIGLHGGNILSVDVHSTDGESAVDDLVVEFPVEPNAGELGTDLSMTAAATIIQMGPAHSVDVVTAVLAALRPRAATGTGTEADPVEEGRVGPELVEGLAAVCPATEWSVIDRAPGQPDGAGLAENDPRRLQLVIPVPGSTQALVGRRSTTMSFTSTELARIDAVVSLWADMNATGMR